jgi:cytochrome bd-type quinol oxidase subunit 1
MTSLEAARVQMDLSPGFHMLFASVGMALPVMLLIVERRWMRTGDREALALAKTWSKATVTLLLAGWGVAQYPYLIAPDLTVPVQGVQGAKSWGGA